MGKRDRNRLTQICPTDFRNSAKTIKWRKDGLFRWTSNVQKKKMIVVLYLKTYTKFNPKHTTNLNISHKV